MQPRQFALVALAAMAFAAGNQTSDAAVLFDISGGVVPGETYGAAAGDNNVINDKNWTPAQQTTLGTGSGIYDGSAGAFFRGSTLSTNTVLSLTGLNAGQQYSIAWFYAGSESGDTIRFFVSNGSSGPLSPPGFAQTNSNNSTNPANQLAGSAFLGVTGFTSSGTTSVPFFTLIDDTTGATVTNGSANAVPAAQVASLIFAYADYHGGKFTLTDTPTNYVVFGFNDGSGDESHDDYVGVAAIVYGGDKTATPLPTTLPLFVTGLGALGLLGWRRKSPKSVARR